MHERLLPASPNWYCSRCSDTNINGILGFGAKNTIYLAKVTPASSTIVGELSGHKERVSGFAFSQYAGQENLCVSSSDDGTVKIWDIDQRAVLTEHRTHQNTISAVHWSPVEKSLVVSGDEKGIVVCFWHSRNDVHSFFPEPRTIFCLSCSPHNENYVAVGYKDGMIVLIDVSKKGDVIHRLRGHDDEIHALAWSPQPHEEVLYNRTEENTEVTNGVGDGDGTGCYLASGSRDQTVRIWSTARGKGVMTLKLPFLKRRGAGADPGVKERLWLTVHWPRGRPNHVVSSCFGGELVLWDLTKTGKQKWSLLGASADGQNHSRIVFNMSSVHMDQRHLLISTSMDREIKCWDLDTLEWCWTLPTLGGFVYAMSFSPVGTGALALGVGDNMIRVWNTLAIQNQYDTKVFWQGIKSKVTALAWHPVKEGSLAFGTDDGKVGIYDVYSNKPPQTSSSYHRKTVYTLAWGPPVPPLSFGNSGDKPSYSLYSCAGEGVILQHDPWKLSGDATNIDKVIRETNNIKHKLSPHTDMCWKPDGRAVAIGNEDGSIDIYEAPSLRLVCSIQQHHKLINALCWHHSHSTQPDLQYLLASGSNNALVYVHDLRSALETAVESPVLLTEAYRSLSGHTAKITGLDWSPHHDGRLVTVCYDGTAQVWDILKGEPLVNYRGHKGRLLCVQWSPVNSDLIWTGGDDFTVQEWAASKQEHTNPPKSKRGMEHEKKKGQTVKSKGKKKKKTGTKKGQAAEGNESPSGEEDKGGVGTGPSENEEEEEEEERGSTSTPLISDSGLPKESRSPMDRSAADRMQNVVKPLPTVKKEVKEEKRKEKPESLLKKRKPRSILPLSTSMDHRPKEQLQLDCLTLAQVKHSHGALGQCVPGSGDQIQLGLFTDREALYRMFQEEEESHVEAGHFDSVMYLRLWKGDVAGALKLATERGELSDHLLSLAPMAGYKVWASAVEAYVKQLCLQEQYLKAASHLLSIHKVYEAVHLLKSHQFYREAIALAKARLQADDPALRELYMSWAAVLEKDGHYSAAAKCYLAADAGFDAAKVSAKKGDVTSLKTAANLARVAGEKDLSHSLSLRCAKDLMLAQDWLAAQDILSAQETLLSQRLLLCVAELLTLRLSRTEVVAWTCSSAHPWATPSDDPFLRVIPEVWEREFNVDLSDPDKLRAVYQQLKTTDAPPANASVPLKQLLSHVALHVTLGVLSWLLGDWGSVVEELLRAVARGAEVGNFALTAEMCRILLPDGLDSVLFLKQKLSPEDDASLTAAHNLEAFYCYQQMYCDWWNQSHQATKLTNGHASSSHQTPGEVQMEDASQNGGSDPDVVALGTEGDARSTLCSSLSFWKVLLSEPHAMAQATQRTIAEVQQRVASLIQQHSSSQVVQSHPETHTDSQNLPQNSSTSTEQGAGPGGQSGSLTDADSLPALTALVCEHHKTLANCPEYVKKFPFPDVLECCLVFLYMERHSASVPPQLREEVLGLLRKFGTTGSFQKSWQKFVSQSPE
ncbi:gem-associated protein 5 [Chanos chanos]|uniref:Gem-associated protein 5 n=1 Tax=Chanos chanos TaxID=29144 RepID=A0A6J2WY91_CHACN|nr:gem-associated protein 5 [Chanos chanos]